ncbi:MAG: FG-GAP repeat protein, partial [Verrucomicrobiales bacterium]
AEESTYSRYFGSTGNGRFGVPVCGGHDCDGDGQLDVAFAAIIGSPFGRIAAGNVTIVWGNGTVLGETIDTDGVGERFLHIAGAQMREACGAEIWMDDVDGDGLGDFHIGRQNFTPAPSRPGAGALTILFGGPELRELSQNNGTLDLLNPPDNVRMLNLYGGRAYDRLGIWMRTGDLDGDGIADIAVGADEADEIGAPNRGEVIALRGGPHLREVSVVDLADSPAAALSEHLVRIYPPEGSFNAHFGATIQLGDLDGNGLAELVIAATIDRAGAALRLTSAPAGTG